MRVKDDPPRIKHSLLDPAKPGPDMRQTWRVERVQESTFFNN